jgi:hypothetical protein
MSKLGYRFALPAINFVLAAALLMWGRHVSPPYQYDFPYASAVVTVCKAITPPAVLFQILSSSALPKSLNDGSSLFINRLGVDDMLFLLGVIGAWYCVGWVIDRRAKLCSSRSFRSTKMAFGLLSMLVGLSLFCIGLIPLVDRRSFAHPTASVVAGVLWLAWSLALVLVPASYIRRLLIVPGATI